MTAQDIVDSEAYYTELSLYVNPQTPAAAKLSCGGVIEATLSVARGLMKKAFAIVRPPGHHSEPDEHMGFCFFNNVAVAAKVVQQLTPVRRILILDWSVSVFPRSCRLLTPSLITKGHTPRFVATSFNISHSSFWVVGNGTQRAFYDDPSVLYVSLHRYENGTYYPNGPFGSMISCGDGPGEG